MDILRQQELQQSIASRMMEFLSPYDWDSVTIYWSEVGVGGSHSVFSPRDASGGRVVTDPPPRVSAEFTALRADMADPVTGAWYSTEFSLSRDGSYRSTYNYTERVYWHGTKPEDPPSLIMPTDQAYRDDLARYPRAPEHVPVWMPAPVEKTAEEAEIDQLLRRPFHLPEGLEPFRTSRGWRDVFISTHVAIHRYVEEATQAGKISLDSADRARLAEMLFELLDPIAQYVHNDVLAAHPVAMLQRLWSEIAPTVAPVLPDTTAEEPVGIDVGVPLWNAMSDPGVQHLHRHVLLAIQVIAKGDLESRFGVRPTRSAESRPAAPATPAAQPRKWFGRS